MLQDSHLWYLKPSPFPLSLFLLLHNSNNHDHLLGIKGATSRCNDEISLQALSDCRSAPTSAITIDSISVG